MEGRVEKVKYERQESMKRVVLKFKKILEYKQQHIVTNQTIPFDYAPSALKWDSRGEGLTGGASSGH